jgi:hypothetical protein
MANWSMWRSHNYRRPRNNGSSEFYYNYDQLAGPDDA